MSLCPQQIVHGTHMVVSLGLCGEKVTTNCLSYGTVEYAPNRALSKFKSQSRRWERL